MKNNNLNDIKLSSPIKAPLLFTLVELLIVIAIIALLAGMLLPALKKAKDAAKSIICMNRQKQLALGVLSYTNDFDNYRPAIFTSAPTYKGWNVILAEFDYLPNEDNKVWLCPIYPPENVSDSSTNMSHTIGMNRDSPFTPNITYYHWYSYYKMTQSRYPLEDILLGDSINTRDHFQQSNFYRYSAGTPYRLHLRHNKSANVIFYDGHADHLNLSEIRSLKSFTEWGMGNKAVVLGKSEVIW